MSQARALYRVQEIELAVIERRKRIKEIDIQLEDNAVIQEAQSQLDDAQAHLDSILKQLKDVELQIEAVANKHKATETRLYSGTVKNPKELQDMGKQVESLIRRREHLDDKLLEVMVERDEATELHQLTDEEFQQISNTWEAEHAEQLAEKTQLTTESGNLMIERKKALLAVHPDAMKEYNSMRTAKSNRPVATLEDKTSCSACGIEQNNAIISAVKKDDSLVKCQNCGRILVRL
jgi:uncharacterized protein